MNPRWRRGDLSGPIYTILMIIFVVVASLMIFNYFQTRASILTAQAQLAIVNAQLAGSIYSVTVQNIGTVPVRLTEIAIYPEDSGSPIARSTVDAVVAPGDSTTIVGSADSKFRTGSRYIIVVRGVTEDGRAIAVQGIAIAQ